MELSVVVLPAPFEPAAPRANRLHVERDVGNADEIAVMHFQMLDAQAVHQRIKYIF